MKRSLILFLALLVCTMLHAQITHTSQGNVDENAEKVLSNAYSKINASCVSFKVTMVSKDANKKETSRNSAQVLFNKGKYRVTMDGTVIYCDGATVWTWNKDAKEVVVDGVSASDDDLINPAKLLANYKKNYRAKFIRNEDDGTAVVDLTPKKSKSFHKARLLISAAGMLKSMELFNFDGSRQEFLISDFKKSVKLVGGEFQFDAVSHKDVEVIDMR